ncbi:phosphoadenosine phosphosulfate reductase domain-containing protein [Tessaracoccus coleopterorum]|uniref:phosphoadenosine phosphosulfate reductase domain-containing protein n=1 Tax=Tessaracoccus coleopterorum TaxID=2714950 RepID=UPI0038CD71F9
MPRRPRRHRRRWRRIRSHPPTHMHYSRRTDVRLPSADPGLDLRHLAGLRRQTHPTTALVDRIAAHLDQNDGYLAFSGGKDSLVALHLARQADPTVPVCFFDSGLEYPETLRYIADLADAWHLNLDVIRAHAPPSRSWSPTAHGHTIAP